MSDSRWTESTKYLICPHCGQVCGEFDTVLGVNAPQSGDYAICCHCAGVSIHVSPTAARLPTDYEAQQILEDPALTDLRAEVLLELMMRGAS